MDFFTVPTITFGILFCFFVIAHDRDLLDDVIVLNERHLKRLMDEYILYYHDDRTHLGLAKETPSGRKAEANPGPECSRVIAMPRMGGLHHRYRLAHRPCFVYKSSPNRPSKFVRGGMFNPHY